MASLTDREIDAIARRIVADIGSETGAARPIRTCRGAAVGRPGRASSPPSTKRCRPPGERSRRSCRLPLKTRARDHRRDPPDDARARGGAGEGRPRGDRPRPRRGQGRQEPARHREDARHRGPAARRRSPATTACRSSSRRPFGVIGAITPVTNPTSTIICNAIGMLAAGNAVVFNVHPSAQARARSRPSRCSTRRSGRRAGRRTS